MSFKAALTAILAIGFAAPVAAQEARETEQGSIEPVSGFTGQMSMTMETPMPEDMAVTEVIRFEPWQMLDEMFRDDLVYVMRGGPTNWAQSDGETAAAMDCDDQRLMTKGGQDNMRQLGALLVANGLGPGEIRVSEWCRTQQTFVSMERGMLDADMNALDGVNVSVDPRLNLFGAEHGNDTVLGLRDAIMEWDGGDEEGPLLLITHFTNIAELLKFNVYEGEMLMVDPKRNGRVLGYLRLGSATPDSVRFDPSVVIADVDLLGTRTNN
ncbi:MAG: hypothetical protein AAF919_07995 [Pseudomonadota bacterium]